MRYGYGGGRARTATHQRTEHRRRRAAILHALALFIGTVVKLLINLGKALRLFHNENPPMSSCNMYRVNGTTHES